MRPLEHLKHNRKHTIMTPRVEDSTNGDTSFGCVYVQMPEQLAISCPRSIIMDKDALLAWICDNHRETILKHLSISLREDAFVDRYKKQFDVLDQVANVQRGCTYENSKMVYTALINGIVQLIQCELGFIGEVKKEADGSKSLMIHSTTIVGWEAETIKFLRNLDHPGIRNHKMGSFFDKVILDKQPIVSNNAQRDVSEKLPPGHPFLRNFLAIPVADSEGEVIGIICTANRDEGFTQHDVSFLKPFANSASNLIQTFWAAEKSDDVIKERTLNLEKANESLEQANRQIQHASKTQLQHFACMR